MLQNLLGHLVFVSLESYRMPFNRYSVFLSLALLAVQDAICLTLLCVSPVSDSTFALVLVQAAQSSPAAAQAVCTCCNNLHCLTLLLVL